MPVLQMAQKFVHIGLHMPTTVETWLALKMVVWERSSTIPLILHRPGHVRDFSLAV